MMRGQHRPGAGRTCTRCQYPSRGQCPPSYWMTPEELAQWERLGWPEYATYEMRLGTLAEPTPNRSEGSDG
jgi:hypothetical protein